MAIERHYVRYLREWGADVTHLATADIVHGYVTKNIINRALFRIGLHGVYKKVNRMLLGKAAEYKPDFILVFKGMEIFPDTVKLLKKRSRLANYNPDHPFIFSGKGSGNQNVTDAVGLFDLHFCYSRNLQQQIEEKFGVPTTFLPFGYEMTYDDLVLAKAAPEIRRVCFLGNPDVNRVQHLKQLATAGIPVDIYGHSWKMRDFNGLPNVIIHDAVYGREFWVKLRQYRVQLNVFRRHNIGSHNMRTFEIPAVGGIELSPYSEEQAFFFEEGHESFYYRNEEEMIRLAEQLLKCSPDEATTYRSAAECRSKKDDNSYRHRARTVFETFNSY